MERNNSPEKDGVHWITGQELREIYADDLSLDKYDEIRKRSPPASAYVLYCENCGNRYFRILEMREKSGNRNQDVIIEKTYFLRCQRCGSEQMEHVLTIVPSWSGPCIDRDALPVWEGEEE